MDYRNKYLKSKSKYINAKKYQFIGGSLNIFNIGAKDKKNIRDHISYLNNETELIDGLTFIELTDLIENDNSHDIIDFIHKSDDPHFDLYIVVCIIYEIILKLIIENNPTDSLLKLFDLITILVIDIFKIYKSILEIDNIMDILFIPEETLNRNIQIKLFDFNRLNLEKIISVFIRENLWQSYSTLPYYNHKLDSLFNSNIYVDSKLAVINEYNSPVIVCVRENNNIKVFTANGSLILNVINTISNTSNNSSDIICDFDNTTFHIFSIIFSSKYTNEYINEYNRYIFMLGFDQNATIISLTNGNQMISIIQ